MATVKTTPRGVAVVQQGVYIITGTIWAEPSTLTSWPGPPFGASFQGQRYQLYTDMTIDKPRTCSLSLFMIARGIGVTLGPVTVALQNLANAPAFSDPANLPPNPYAALPADWVQFAYDDGSGWAGGLTLIPLGTVVTDPVNNTTFYTLSNWAHIFEHSDAGGFINLSVLIETGVGTATVAPALIVDELPFFTGIDNHGVEMGRPVRDMRTGLPTHVDQLVEDGYRPGIWTTSDQWDPADPRDERPTELPDSEGVWDDDVPA